MKSLFGMDGINLSILRQPIGASDFNWESWTFDDVSNLNQSATDFDLRFFSLWRENDYIKPMLDMALSINPQNIKLFASPWSPPAW